MSDEKKTDRRVRRTQKLLKDGLAELLSQKEIYKITVQELCDKVDINRAVVRLRSPADAD